MTDVVNVGNLDAAAPAAPIPHEHSRTGLSADALRRAISDHLTFSIARPPSALTAEHYYRALALAVRDRIQQRWMATTRARSSSAVRPRPATSWPSGSSG